MHSEFVERPANAYQRSITSEQIVALHTHTFGAAPQLAAIREQSGGTVNNTYLLEREAAPPIMLRVAPAASNPGNFRHEGRTLRREWAVQPFLAPVAGVVPQILAADFSNRMLDRDYLFQSFMPGTLWKDIHKELAVAEQHDLWRQLGTITRQIHGVHGEAFGVPDPAPPFAHWSAAVLHEGTGILQDLAERELPNAELVAVLAQATAHQRLFDQIATPCLLHGDLWLNNLLVERAAGGTRITGALDAGFARWGDPLADWTIMRMLLAPMEHAEPFWETYGPIDQQPAARFRTLVYQAYTLGTSLLEYQRLRLHTYIPEALVLLRQTVAALATSVV